MKQSRNANNDNNVCDNDRDIEDSEEYHVPPATPTMTANSPWSSKNSRMSR